MEKQPSKNCGKNWRKSNAEAGKLKRYRLSQQALEDIKQIRDYYREVAGTSTARSVLSEITDGLRFVAQNPGAGHRRGDLTDLPLRFWRVNSYLVAYSALHRPVEIVRVLHGSRDVAALLDDR